MHVAPRILSMAVIEGHSCHHTILESIAAIIHLWKALLPSYIFEGHCCHHIYVWRALTMPLLPSYIVKGHCSHHIFFEEHCCHHTFLKGIGVIIHFWRALLSSYIFKWHCSHQTFCFCIYMLYNLKHSWVILVTLQHHCRHSTWPRRTRHISWWPLVAATCKEVRPRVSLFFSSSVDLQLVLGTWQIVQKKPKSKQSQVRGRRRPEQRGDYQSWMILSPWEKKADNTNVTGKTSQVKSRVTFDREILADDLWNLNYILKNWMRTVEPSGEDGAPTLTPGWGNQNGSAVHSLGSGLPGLILPWRHFHCQSMRRGGEPSDLSKSHKIGVSHCAIDHKIWGHSASFDIWETKHK